MRIDPYSNTWLVIEAHLTQRIADLRSRLEGNLSWDETQKVRASLQECKTLLELAGDRTPLVESDIEIPG
jgi:hypothetical protein